VQVSTGFDLSTDCNPVVGQTIIFCHLHLVQVSAGLEPRNNCAPVAGQTIIYLLLSSCASGSWIQTLELWILSPFFFQNMQLLLAK
jgi:hypothetical protein